MTHSLKLAHPSSIVWPVATAMLFGGTFLYFPGFAAAFSAIVGGASLAVVTVVSPFAGLLTLLTIIPFQVFLDFYFPAMGSIFFGAALRDVVTGLLLLGYALHKMRKRTPAAQLQFPEKLALAYVLLVSFFIPLAPVLAGALVAFRNLALYVCLMLVAAEFVTTRHRLQLVSTVLLTAGLVAALIGIAEAVTNRQFFGWIRYDIVALMGSELPDVYFGLPRATGGTGNPLEFGLHMAIVAVLCIAFSAAKVSARRGFILTVLAASLLALTFTLARSAYVSLAVGFLTLAILLRKKVLLVPILALLPLAVAISMTPYSQLLVARLTVQDEPGIVTAQQRAEIWGLVLKEVTSSITGKGLGTQGGSMERGRADPDLAVTDNYYGNIAMQIGIVPLSLFLVLLLSLGRRFLRLFRSLRDSSLRAYAAVGVSVLVMIVVNSFASSSFESRVISITVWTLLGASLHLDRMATSATVQLAVRSEVAGPERLAGPARVHGAS
jgi:hypothetical protein